MAGFLCRLRKAAATDSQSWLARALI